MIIEGILNALKEYVVVKEVVVLSGFDCYSEQIVATPFLLSFSNLHNHSQCQCHSLRPLYSMNQSTQQDMAIELVHPSFDQTNPHNVPNGSHEPSTEELEAQLPVVDDGQVHLGDLVSRVVQTIFAELSELAET